MSPRARVGLIVGALALLAAVVVVGAAVLSSDEIVRPAEVAPAGKAQEGAPRLALALGLVSEADAEVLRSAVEAYEAGRLEQAAGLFAESDSLEAKLGAAFAAWPGSLDRVEQLGALYPRSAMVQLHVGIARFWAGRRGAVEAWREAQDVEPDTPYAVRAGDLLQPEFAPGLPILVSDARVPSRDTKNLSPAEQLEALRKEAQDGPLDARLLYGIALQGAGRPVSAREVYAAAAEAFPDEPEALVADAIGRYTKERPAEAFSRLGPLSRRFPESASVRFHLGLLLLWQGDVKPARRQLRLAEQAGPGSLLARRASLYLDELAQAGTG